MLNKSELPQSEINQSITIFRHLAEAEAKVHGTTIQSVHFHEIGAVDTIIDVVGAVCGLRLLNIEHVIVSPFPIGKVGPAAIELLKDFPVFGIEEQRETVTPTGAAILSVFAEGTGVLPLCSVKTVGYGAWESRFSNPAECITFHDC